MTWFVVLVLTWLVVAALTLQARRRGARRLARRWGTRLCAVTLVPVTALALGAVLVLVQLVSTDGATAATAIEAATPYATWLALAVNLVSSDIALRGDQARARARTRARSGADGIRVHEPFAARTGVGPRS
ncbi:hypothetical protein GCM10022415_00320 [Knoellia locipacati]|uniref:Uncharacterized protein n=1 Tax=Knoellia locipacati TaxID=882824 RepID=A0A512SVP6_9MICO|nr:hypothetical protein [Knoellia locipacati]GEQ11985.1 hypothetical protein KLO01_00320 [Knoellia locipacati]